MRNMSFACTERQLLDGTKTVTRRLGWRLLEPGDLVCAVRKCQGLKKGDKIHRLGVIEILITGRELLETIIPADVRREGFPGMLPTYFVEMFCKLNKCNFDTMVTRIEFRLKEAAE